ncbi:MAG: hypothetical protein ACREJ0_21590 [Geminicoccaceae bacterium]
MKDILDHADELADRFEAYEPRPEDKIDVETFAALREAASARVAAERAVVVAVNAARAQGMSWAKIGRMLGTTGEAARQRYAS